MHRPSMGSRRPRMTDRRATTNHSSTWIMIMTSREVIALFVRILLSVALSCTSITMRARILHRRVA